MMYRVRLEDGRVFGADGRDQPTFGMPSPPAKALEQGMHCLTRSGFETFGKNLHDEIVEILPYEDASDEDIIYQDVFQVVLRPGIQPVAAHQKKPSDIKKRTARKNT